MTLSELITAVRFKSNITNTATLSDDQITTELNQGYWEIFRSIVEVNEDYYEEQKTVFDLSANIDFMALPDDHIKFKQLRLAYTTPSDDGDYVIAKSYDPSEINRPANEETVPVNSPIVDVTNNFYRIKPTPDSGVVSGGQLYYIARPSALVNSADSPVIPSEYHDLMSVYAASRVSEKFENFKVSDRYYNQFLQKIEKMKEQLAVRELNREFRFKDPRENNKSNRIELPN